MSLKGIQVICYRGFTRSWISWTKNRTTTEMRAQEQCGISDIVHPLPLTDLHLACRTACTRLQAFPVLALKRIFSTAERESQNMMMDM